MKSFLDDNNVGQAPLLPALNETSQALVGSLHIDDNKHIPGINEFETDVTLPGFREKVREDILNAKVIGMDPRSGYMILLISPKDPLKYLRGDVYSKLGKVFSDIGAHPHGIPKNDKYNNTFDQIVLVRPGFDTNKVAGEKSFEELLASFNPSVDGGYRISSVEKNIDSRGNLNTPMGHFFHFPPDTLQWLVDNNYKELGTAWVDQSSFSTDRAQVGVLYSIRHGIASVMAPYQVGDPDNNQSGFIGKISIPKNYDAEATVIALYYLNKYYTKQGEFTTPTPKQQYHYTVDKLLIDKFTENNPYGSNISPQFIQKMVEAKKQELEEFCNKYLVGNYAEDTRLISELLVIGSGGRHKFLPAMVPLYLSRVDDMTFLQAVLNGIIEAGVIIGCRNLKAEVKSQFINPAKERWQKHGQDMTPRDILKTISKK